MKFLAFAAALLLASPAWAQNQGTVQCNQSAFYDASAVGSTQLVAAASSGGVGERVYVCGYTLNVGATATNVSLSFGTGTNCATGTTGLTPVWVLAASQFMVDNAYGAPLVVPPGNALCVTTSAANPVKVLVRYLQMPGM